VPGRERGNANRMATDIAQRFIDALHQLEDDRDAGALADLYADGAVSGNTATTRTYDGPDGARQFWTAYRETFSDIRSEFRNVVGGNGAVALEWTSKGTLEGGDEVSYEGVTVLETDGEHVTRSTAYFDPRAIVGHLSGALR
jgi:ketosteroid isomerase-like protein